jgi:[ribosomal protein S5]-alanine N-acetyltransferase
MAVMKREQTVPTLHTPRLILRPFALEDAPVVVELAGQREIADTTISVPHPYSEVQARDWISKQVGLATEGKEISLAITVGGDLIGAVGLRDIHQEHWHAELGSWIGVPWWGKGYATEAALAVLGFAFEQLELNRVHAHHMVRNPASGRVLQKIGMRKEGVLRQAVRKWGVFEDVVILAILREDWLKNTKP